MLARVAASPLNIDSIWSKLRVHQPLDNTKVRRASYFAIELPNLEGHCLVPLLSQMVKHAWLYWCHKHRCLASHFFPVRSCKKFKNKEKSSSWWTESGSRLSLTDEKLTKCPSGCSKVKTMCLNPVEGDKIRLPEARKFGKLFTKFYLEHWICKNALLICQKWKQWTQTRVGKCLFFHPYLVTEKTPFSNLIDMCLQKKPPFQCNYHYLFSDKRPIPEQSIRTRFQFTVVTW